MNEDVKDIPDIEMAEDLPVMLTKNKFPAPQSNIVPVDEKVKDGNHNRRRDLISIWAGIIFVAYILLAMLYIAISNKDNNFTNSVLDFFKNIALIIVGYIFSRYNPSDKNN